MADLYRLSALSELLNKDRGTLRKALADVPPDGHSPRGAMWSLASAKRAVARRAYPAPSGRSERPIDRYYPGKYAAFDALRHDIDEALQNIEDEPNPRRKRELALAAAPIIERSEQVYLAAAHALDRVNHPEALQCRAELIFSALMSEFADAAQWPRDACWTALADAMPSTPADERLSQSELDAAMSAGLPTSR